MISAGILLREDGKYLMTEKGNLLSAGEESA